MKVFTFTNSSSIDLPNFIYNKDLLLIKSKLKLKYKHILISDVESTYIKSDILAINTNNFGVEKFKDLIRYHIGLIITECQNKLIDKLFNILVDEETTLELGLKDLIQSYENCCCKYIGEEFIFEENKQIKVKENLFYEKLIELKKENEKEAIHRLLKRFSIKKT